MRSWWGYRGHLVAAVVTSELLFVGCGLDDTVVATFGSSDASFAGDGPPAGDAAPPLFDSGGDATIGTTVCTALTLCDDGGACGGGSACVPPIPTGWSLVGFDSLGSTACAAGYASHGAFAITDGGPAQCSCTCTAGAAPSCTNLQAVLTTGAACASSPATENISGACSSVPGAGFTPTNAGAIEAHLQPQPGTCTSGISKSEKSWDAGATRECEFGGDGGEFCSGHATCVVSSGAPHSVCIAQPYSGVLPPTCVSACPSGFTASCNAVANAATDTRDCAACTCGWDGIGCGTPTVTVTANGNCTGPSTTITPDTCAATTITTIGGVLATGSAATPSCGKTVDTSPAGAVTPSGQHIVCCAN